MPNLEQFMQNPQAGDLIGDRKKLESLMNTPETQKLFTMLNQKTEGGLEQAAESAAKGESKQLISAIKQLMENPEAAQLIQAMKSKLK